jgi:glycosyltransferase involved in cell wall biosynthesis
VESFCLSRLVNGAPLDNVKLIFVNDSVYKYASGAPSAVGGAERQQWLLARALAAAGWSTIVAVSEELKAGKRTLIDGVEFVGITPGHGHVLSAWYRFLLSERPDYWYWRGANHLLGPTVEIAKLARVSTIFAAAFDTDVRPSRALSQRARWWPLYAWGLSRTEKIFVQHSGQLSDLPSKLRHKAAIVPSMIHTLSTITPHQERQPYIAWVGMLRQPKRPDLLLEIARKSPHLRFVVCGGPSDHRSPTGFGARIAAELNVLPNVDFRGQVPPDKAHETIANASLLLCTSEGEGFPNIFLEAWSSGTPVVSLKIDPDHVIESLRLGTVSGTVEGAISDLNGLMSSPERRDKIAVRARRHVMATHSETAVVAAFESALYGSRTDTRYCHTNSCQPSSSSP